MDEKSISEIIQQNLASLMENDSNSSMRYLSTCIGASDSYIQKIMSNGSLPSLDKLEAIGQHYDVDTWTLLYDYEGDSKEMLSLVQSLNRLPSDLLPVVKSYVDYLDQLETERKK